MITKRIPIRLVHTMLLAGISIGPAAAQVAATGAAPIEDVVVLGRPLEAGPGATAYGTTQIDRARLTGDASGRLEDVLLDVAGFQQFRRSDSRSANPSAQGVTLRALGGNASSRALVLLDGVPQADPFFGYIPFNALVPDRLSSVRVTRGGGAGAFGAGAVAGTIELASATRRDLPTIEGSALYGSRDSRSITAALSPDVGTGYVTASGRFERGDGYFTTPEGSRTVADVPARYRDWSGSLRAVAPIGASTELQARLLVFRDNRTLRFRGADSSSQGQDASIRLIHRGDWAVDALAYVQARDFTNKVISSTNFRLTLDQRATPSTGVGGKIELRPPVGDAHLLRIGVDARHADGELFEDAYSTVTGLITARRNAGGTTSTLGAFAEDDWTLGALVLTGGVRADRWAISNGFFRERSAAGVATSDRMFADRSGTAISTRAGAVLGIGAGASLRAAGYTGFRLPTINELYRPFTVFPIVTQANDALKLEKLKGAEAGFDWAPSPAVTVGVTAFYNRLDDAIANVTIGTNLRQRRNVDAIVARGVELTARVARGPASLTASYAYSNATVRGSGPSIGLDGFVPAQSPRHAASATLALAPIRGPGLSLTARYVGDQYEDDLQTNILPDALTVDAAATLPIGRHFSIVARGENLFDAAVVTRNSGGSIDLGTPRTLWIGVRLR